MTDTNDKPPQWMQDRARDIIELMKSPRSTAAEIRESIIAAMQEAGREVAFYFAGQIPPHVYADAIRDIEQDKPGFIVSGFAKAIDSAKPAGEPIHVEAVATVRASDECPMLDWLIEGDISALQDGQVLVIADRQITDDDGSGEIYLAAAPAPSPVPQWAKGDPMEEAVYRAVYAYRLAHGPSALIKRLGAPIWTPEDIEEGKKRGDELSAWLSGEPASEMRWGACRDCADVEGLICPNSGKPCGEAEPASAPSEVFPIARLHVVETGDGRRMRIKSAVLYAPGLPPGVHDVYPVPVDARRVPLAESGPPNTP